MFDQIGEQEMDGAAADKWKFALFGLRVGTHAAKQKRQRRFDKLSELDHLIVLHQ